MNDFFYYSVELFQANIMIHFDVIILAFMKVFNLSHFQTKQIGYLVWQTVGLRG